MIPCGRTLKYNSTNILMIKSKNIFISFITKNNRSMENMETDFQVYDSAKTHDLKI